MAGESSAADREHQFRDLLLSISRQLKRQDVKDLSYLVNLTDDDDVAWKPLDLLKAIRNKGQFSPFYCSPLAELLRKIERHDLADEVTNQYVILHPDQTSPLLTRAGRIPERHRSATDPFLPSTGSFPPYSETGPTSLPTTSSFLGTEGFASLDNVCTTDHGLNHVNHQGFTRSTASRSSISSQSSHGSQYSGYVSSSSSCMGSRTSLAEAVLERASRLLLQDVKANYTNQSKTLPSPPPPPLSPQPPLSAHTLPSRRLPPPDYSETIATATDGVRDTIQGPTISEIMSEEEGLDERRGTLECPATVASRNRKLQEQLAIPRPHVGDSNIEQSRTPRVSMVVADELTDFENTLHAHLQPTTITSPVLDERDERDERDEANQTKDHPDQSALKTDCPPPPPPSRSWRKLWLHLKSRNKTTMQKLARQGGEGDVVLWKVQREELGRPIWNHDKKCCITRSSKYDLDTHLGRYNPKLQFQLYPYGESEDCGESMTMIVRIHTSDRTPPLPSSASVSIVLSVYDEQNGRKHSLNCCTAQKPLDLGYFPIRRVVTHDALRKSKSKFIHFEMKITSYGFELESFSRKRLSTQ